MNLASLKSVKAFAEKWKKTGRPVHILINNAGVGAMPYRETEDGIQEIFATNHLGHFLLTNLLLDNLKMGSPSRVVVVSSLLQTEIALEDISGKNTWYNGTGLFATYLGPFVAYGQSKTANILFSIKLNEKMKNFGTSNSLHPGAIKTALNRRLPRSFSFVQWENLVLAIIGKTVEQGAATQVYVATSPELDGIGGKFFDNCNEAEPQKQAKDPEAAEKLWKMSEKMVAKYLE